MTNISDHVCSPESAKMLFDLGIKQDSVYFYRKYSMHPVPMLMERSPYGSEIVTLSGKIEYEHAAFLATELVIPSDYAVLSHDDAFVGYKCVSWDGPEFAVIPNSGIVGDREVDARANMIAYLKKIKVI